MKKLFISQPMKGKSPEEIQRERDYAIETAKITLDIDEIKVLDTYFKDFNPEGGSVPLKFLARSLAMLADADIAYFARGWHEARGCLIEMECAKRYQIECLYDPNFTMRFEEALELAQHGCRIFRDGWNGKGLSVVYQKGYPDGIACNKQTAEAWGMKEGELFKCDPYLQISTVQGGHAMWVPSIRDLLADDWRADAVKWDDQK